MENEEVLKVIETLEEVPEESLVELSNNKGEESEEMKDGEENE